MKARQSRELGQEIHDLVESGDVTGAYELLAPVLDQRTPFKALDRIGLEIGRSSVDNVYAFLEQVASGGTEGGWVIIGSVLRQRSPADLRGVLARCRHYIVLADTWYGADIMGERVPGPALVDNFALTLAELVSWREDPCPWVRRAVGVSVHFWAKRSAGEPGTDVLVNELLAFLAPLYEEWDIKAVKGIGWGFKSLGRYYPDQLSSWLAQHARRPHRAIMLRKALTYLPEEERNRIMELNRP